MDHGSKWFIMLSISHKKHTACKCCGGTHLNKCFVDNYSGHLPNICTVGRGSKVIYGMSTVHDTSFMLHGHVKYHTSDITHVIHVNIRYLIKSIG